jgi:SAM-dependent methyltransferase
MKRVLKSVGILETVRLWHGSLKFFQPSLFFHELRIRMHGAPDGQPIPPSRLIFLIIGHGWKFVYFNSGEMITANLLALLRKHNINPFQFADILDFGCGCGRLIRHLRALPNAMLHGCDINPNLIDWSKKNLLFAHFSLNQITPPLIYKNQSMDFIYARSVFTHLGEKLQQEWMVEFFRILRPGGILLFSTQGEQFYSTLTPKMQDLFRSNRLVENQGNTEGRNDFGSFQSLAYIQNHLYKGFKLISLHPGENSEHFQQDIVIAKRT